MSPRNESLFSLSRLLGTRDYSPQMNRAAKLSVLLALAFAFLSATAFTQTPPSSPSISAAYPANYKEIVTAWLNSHLEDPKSVIIKWLGDPKPAELKGANGEKIAGYLVEFTVNARNRFGTYTGAQKHGALIREGQVVKATGFGYR